MKTSDRVFDLHEKHEGCRLTAYLCPAKKPTIGIGHTKGVTLGDTCTREQAIQFWREDIAEAEAAVDALVSVPLTQGQFDALVSFVFNAGREKFRTSTMLRLLNAGDYQGAAAEIPKWVFGGGRKLNGLVSRRAAEQSLFLQG